MKKQSKWKTLSSLQMEDGIQAKFPDAPKKPAFTVSGTVRTFNDSEAGVASEILGSVEDTLFKDHLGSATRERIRRGILMALNNLLDPEKLVKVGYLEAESPAVLLELPDKKGELRLTLSTVAIDRKKPSVQFEIRPH